MFNYYSDLSCRLFGTKCSRCGLGFSTNDLVMRARSLVYHVDCFRCVACERALIPGDEFALRTDGLFCRTDHDLVPVPVQDSSSFNTSPTKTPPTSSAECESSEYDVAFNNNETEIKGSIGGEFGFDNI